MFGHLPVVFDSAALSARDRIGFAREEYGRKALNVELEVDKDTPFRLRMQAVMLGEVRVAVIESTPYRVQRTPPLIDDGDSRIGLVFPLKGRFGGEQGARNITVGRGEATTMLSDRTGWFGTYTGGAFLTIRAAPGLFGLAAAGMGPLRAGATIRPSRMGFGLLQSYLSSINRAGAGLPGAMRDMAGRHIAELAAHAFCGPEAVSAAQAGGEALRAARAAAALAHMASHFTDPGYGVNACAAHLGISVRYLQLILEGCGLRFGDELKRLRLERARALLADPGMAGLSITCIAYDCGYSDISHFNRQFRSRFGDSPTGLRGR